MTREHINAALDRIRPLLQADGIDLQLIECCGDRATISLAGVPIICAAAPLSFQMGLEEVLRREVEGFGELRLQVQRPGPSTGNAVRDDDTARNRSSRPR